MNVAQKVCEAIALLGGVNAFARALDVKPPTVVGWRESLRNVPPKRCVEIELLTNGAVTRKDLRPHDYKDIWPELSDD